MRRRRRHARGADLSLPGELRLDWCSHAAAEYAVERWHYSGCLPASKSTYLGVWEGGRFIGCVIFGTGAGNVTKGSAFGLPPLQMAELTRVALDAHSAPVSRIVSIAVAMIRRLCPGLRLLVSMADPVRDHHGGIYQAGNWVYVGTTNASKTYLDAAGREHHERVVSPSGRKKQYGRYVPCLRPSDAASIRENPGKHKYLMPLDAAMREQIAPLSKPYPKRVRPNGADEHHSPAGGVAPTRTLHLPSEANGRP